MANSLKAVSKSLRPIYKRLKRYQNSISDYFELRRSARIGIDNIKSVCLMLGPYRNLTSLTAATLFLHPNCQVLNHGSGRIFGNREVDFLTSDFETERLDRFIQFAVQISTKGERGRRGGSISFSHALSKKYKMKEIFEEKEIPVVKEDIKCLFWKESLRTSNIIRDRKIDLARIFSSDERLRFLLPIRNPIDCAVSNIKTKIVNIFSGLTPESSVQEVIDAVLDEILWFADLKKRFPDRFHYFYEYEISRPMLVELARFLHLEPTEDWLASALTGMNIDKIYTHEKSLQDDYAKSVKRKFSLFPELQAGLLHFCQ